MINSQKTFRKNGYTISSLGLALILIFGLWDVQPAQDMSREIRWRASNMDFIDSIYNVLLSKPSPYNAEMRRRIMEANYNTPAIRLSLFEKFVSFNKDYKASRNANLSRKYSVYRKNSGRGYSYYVSKRGTDHLMGTPWGTVTTFPLAMAYVGFLNNFCSGPNRCQDLQSPIEGERVTEISSIRWRASNNEFFDSVYENLLYRAPNFNAKTRRRIAQLDLRTPEKRLASIKSFVNQANYQNSRNARLPKEYSVYRKNSWPGYKYYASKRGTDHLMGTPWGTVTTFPLAMTYVSFLNTFCSGPNRCQGLQSPIAVPSQQEELDSYCNSISAKLQAARKRGDINRYRSLLNNYRQCDYYKQELDIYCNFITSKLAAARERGDKNSYRSLLKNYRQCDYYNQAVKFLNQFPSPSPVPIDEDTEQALTYTGQCPKQNPGKKRSYKNDTNNNPNDGTYVLCRYLNNGMLESQTPYRNGKKHGVHIAYRISSGKHVFNYKYTYKNGFLDGITTHYAWCRKGNKKFNYKSSEVLYRKGKKVVGSTKRFKSPCAR